MLDLLTNPEERSRSHYLELRLREQYEHVIPGKESVVMAEERC